MVGRFIQFTTASEGAPAKCFVNPNVTSPMHNDMPESTPKVFFEQRKVGEIPESYKQPDKTPSSGAKQAKREVPPDFKKSDKTPSGEEANKSKKEGPRDSKKANKSKREVPRDSKKPDKTPSGEASGTKKSKDKVPPKKLHSNLPRGARWLTGFVPPELNREEEFTLGCCECCGKFFIA